MNRSQLLLSVASFLLLANACMPGDEQPTDDDLRAIYFDGAEINAQLAENPDAVFFADVRNGTVVHFDQSEELIDLSNFIFQCPSMLIPVPMEDFLTGLGVDEEILLSDEWTVQSAVSDFRSAAACPPGTESWCPGGPSDCVCISQNSIE